MIPVIREGNPVVDVLDLDVSLSPQFIEVVECKKMSDSLPISIKVSGEEYLTFEAYEGGTDEKEEYEKGEILITAYIAPTDNSKGFLYLISSKTGAWSVTEVFERGDCLVRVLKGSFVVEN